MIGAELSALNKRSLNRLKYKIMNAFLYCLHDGTKYHIELPFNCSQFKQTGAEWTRNFCKQIVSAYFITKGYPCVLRVYNSNGINIASFNS